MKRLGHRGGYAVVIGSRDDGVDSFKLFTDLLSLLGFARFRGMN